MKKRNKKKSTANIAEQNIKILKSGKVKIKKGTKINLQPLIDTSSKDVVISRIDGILSKEDVNIDVPKCTVSTTTTLSSMRRSVDLLSRSGDNTVYTLTHVINKKNALDIFDFMDDSIIGNLLRTSSLGAVYKKVKSAWKDLNQDDKTKFTNVLFIPNILVFLDEKTGDTKRLPYKVNLLLIAEPSISNMSEGIEKVEDVEATRRIIEDVLDAGIKCGCKDMIVNPYCYKQLLNDVDFTAGTFHAITESQRCMEQYHSLTFTVNDDDLYVIFFKAK